MKEELTKKLINAMIGSYTCFFSQQEKEYISKLTIGTMSSFEEKKFFYLLVNTQNDLDKESLANVEGVLSHLSFDFDGSHLIHPNERSANFQYTFHQQIIYNHLGKDNFILIAGTGFGKTTIFANYFMQNYKERKGKWVICVPTELLEQQLIMNLREKYEDQNDKIGNNIFKNDILILTPEKLFLAFSAKIKINQIMVDEAHNLLSQNIDRMVFAQKEILKHINKVEHIYFATPFMNKNNLQNFKKIFAGLKLKYISVHSNNNKKNLVLNKSKNFFISIKDKKYLPETQKEYDSPILIYENNKEKCIDLAYAEINNTKKHQIINPIYMEKELVDARKKFWGRYIPLNLTNYGVSYLHSDMPTQVKNIIIKLVKKKYIKKIFATNAILNGIDLPFQHVFINRTKIFQRNMKPSDFNNLRGRASRWSDSKRGNAFGLAIIKESQSNSKWFNENRGKLNEESSASEIVEDDMTLFVNQSYETYKKEGREIYLLDPRINPETTKQIEENNFEELEKLKRTCFL